MKKIGLFLSADPHCGGMFQYNQAILLAVEALRDEHHEVVIGYTSELWESYLHRGTTPNTVFIKKGFWGRAVWFIWLRLRLSISLWRRICPLFSRVAKALIAARCDLWIFPTQDNHSYQNPVPALASIHDLMHRYESKFPEVSDSGMKRLREWGSRNTCYWTRGVLVDSEVGKHHVMESYGLQESRIHVLPYVAPPYFYTPGVPKGFESRYSLPKKYIFYPAQFWELKPDIPDLKLVLVGSKKNGFPSTLKLIKQLDLLDDVAILGYVPDEDLPELYRRARALIMPTFFGPTNIPPLEAFAAGCPVAISRIYGIPEQVGDAALLFDPTSVDEIAHCIKSLWIDDDLCARLKILGNQKAASWGQLEFNARLRNIVDNMGLAN
jgi:glycosyltransferase involved in cell wall biosynthesis